MALFVIGHSPAIILETLVARHLQGMLPTHVQVITTETGATLLKNRLLIFRRRSL